MFTKKNTCNNSVTLGVKWWSSRSTHQISCFRPVLCVKSFCKTAPCLPASDLRHSTCHARKNRNWTPFHGPSHVVLCPSQHGVCWTGLSLLVSCKSLKNHDISPWSMTYPMKSPFLMINLVEPLIFLGRNHPRSKGGSPRFAIFARKKIWTNCSHSEEISRNSCPIRFALKSGSLQKLLRRKGF